MENQITMETQVTLETTPPDSAHTIFSRQSEGGTTSNPTMMFIMPEYQKPFQCGLCSISFSVNNELVVHVHAHFLNKPYQCGLCKASYESNPDLVSHVKSHEMLFSGAMQGFPTLTPTDAVVPHRENPVAVGSDQLDTGTFTTIDTRWEEEKKTEIKRQETYTMLETRAVSLDGSARAHDRAPHRGITLTAKTSEDDRVTNDDDGDIDQGFDIEELDSKEKCIVEDVKKCDQDGDKVREGDFKQLITHPQQSDSPNELKPHLSSISTVGGRFQCPACDKTFKEKRGLKWHFKVCHEEANVRPHQCRECGKKFKLPHHLKDHLQSVHGHGEKPARPVCPVCKKTFKDLRGLRWHHKVYHLEADVKPYQCQDCGRKFKLRHNLKDHMRAMHGPGDKKVKPWSGDCPVCPLQFESQSELRSHVHSMHTVDGRAECPICKKTFTELRGLKYHFKLCHVEADLRPHQCEECGKKFKVSHHLRDHIKTVHDHVKRRVICHICGKAVSTLSTHVALVHSEARPHTCNFCNRSFKTNQVLQSHMKTHTKEKPYICETCGKSFARKSTMMYHRNTHTNARPFSCEVCHKRFNALSGLFEHKQQHKF